MVHGLGRSGGAQMCRVYQRIVSCYLLTASLTQDSCVVLFFYCLQMLLFLGKKVTNHISDDVILMILNLPKPVFLNSRITI